MLKKSLNRIKNPKEFGKSATNFMLSTDGSLKKKVVRGGFWVFGLRVFRRGFEFVRTIVLARLLAPEDFGLMGVALLAMSALESFSQTGVQQALIQKDEDIDEYLDTAWTIQVIRGLVIAGILFFGAPLVGSFFGEPNAVPLTRALALSEIFKAFTHIGVVYFQKELEFHKQFNYQLSGTLVDLLVPVGVATTIRSPMALISGLVLGNLVRMLISYHVFEFSIIGFSLAKYKQLLNFGRWISLGSVLSFFYTQGDDILLAKLLGTATLGYYQLAYQISNSPATEITHVISKVTFPLYSKLQSNSSRLCSAYLRSIRIITFITTPMAFGVIFLAKDFTLQILGEDWLPAVILVKILAVWGLIRSYGAAWGPLFLAKGRPDIVTKLQFMKVFLLAILIVPLTLRYGAGGTAYAVVLNALVVSPIGLFFASNLISIQMGRILEIIVPNLVSSCIMIVLLYLVRFIFFDVTSMLNLMILILVGIISYFFINTLVGTYLFPKQDNFILFFKELL